MDIEESKIIYECLNATADKGVMFDVGSHNGSSLSPFLAAGWRVFAFEPDENNRRNLNQRKGGNPNLNIDSRALSDKISHEVPFYTSAVSSGISGLSKFHESHQETAKVDVTTVEQFCEERNISSIEYLKIDTEGFDLFVLKGVPWTKIAPEVILCEFEDKKTKELGYSFYDMADYLVEKGYKVIVSEWFPIVEYGMTHSWNCFKEYPCKLDSENAWGNIIAFKNNFEYIKFLNAVVKVTSNCQVLEELEAMRASRAWKATKPIRDIFKILKKIKGKMAG